MAHSNRRGVGLVLGALLAAACGNGDDYDPDATQGNQNFTPPPPPAMDVEPVTPPPAEGSSETPGAAGGGAVPGSAEDVPPVTTPVVPPAEEPPPEQEPTASGCSTPNGVNGRPTTLEDAVILMNTLPRPTTLPCFIEALTRPLQVYMTESDQSLQPSPGPESPRIFIVNEPLVMSIVPAGPASVTLELGYRTQPRRSIKTEIVFPLTRDVTFDTFFDEVLNGAVTRCSACHTSETKVFDPALNIEVFESDIYEPFSVYDVDVETVRAARAACDAAAEPDRCALLGALFDHGEVVPAPEGIMFMP
jgi:hypothetical protein